MRFAGWIGSVCSLGPSHTVSQLCPSPQLPPLPSLASAAANKDRSQREFYALLITGGEFDDY